MTRGRRLARGSWMFAVECGAILLWVALVVAFAVVGRLLEGVIR